MFINRMATAFIAVAIVGSAIAFAGGPPPIWHILPPPPAPQPTHCNMVNTLPETCDPSTGICEPLPGPYCFQFCDKDPPKTTMVACSNAPSGW